MSDDKSKRGPEDRTRINIRQPYEVRHWSKALGVTPLELALAVKLCWAPTVRAVRAKLDATSKLLGQRSRRKAKRRTLKK